MLGTCFRAAALRQGISLPDDTLPGSAGLTAASGQPSADSRQLGSLQGSQRSSQEASMLLQPATGLGQPVGIILDSSPARLTADIAARWAP